VSVGSDGGKDTVPLVGYSEETMCFGWPLSISRYAVSGRMQFTYYYSLAASSRYLSSSACSNEHALAATGDSEKVEFAHCVERNPTPSDARGPACLLLGPWHPRKVVAPRSR
jgi:hypothetical protein